MYYRYTLIIYRSIPTFTGDLLLHSPPFCGRLPGNLWCFGINISSARPSLYETLLHFAHFTQAEGMWGIVAAFSTCREP